MPLRGYKLKHNSKFMSHRKENEDKEKQKVRKKFTPEAKMRGSLHK